MWMNYVLVVIACYLAFTAGAGFVIARQRQGSYWGAIGRVLVSLLLGCAAIYIANF